MGSNRGELGRSLVSSEADMNQESETLCEFCKRLPLREVGLIGSSTKFADRRDIEDILNESHCPFCREVAKAIMKWSCKALGKEVPDLSDGYKQHYGVYFLLNKVASVNRMWIWFATANYRPILQFQRCSWPPLQVSSDGSLCDWESVPRQAFNGRLRPVVADTQLFRKWKDICCSTHGGHCKSLYSGVSPAWLRLIDVEKRCVVCKIDVEKGCVVDSEGDTTYVALSYVWGEGKLSERGNLMPKLTKTHKGLFQEAGSLTREKVLSTIDDAMEVTRSLGEKYLWVDCLCIMQDDEADQGEFILQMDSIYGFASVTIVAAWGDNADAGLPGIRPYSRTCEQEPFTVLKGISLMQTLDPEGSKHKPKEHYHYLEDSVWSTRGWTFQEKMVSRRALIFTEEQVYWECQAATWCEDSLWETMQDSTVFRPCFSKDFRRPWMTSFGFLYRNLVVEYTRRSLTCQSDGLNAFEGILNALRREASQHFLWALPTSLLHSCLTWSCDDRPIKRRETLCPVTSCNGTTHCPFPSWSWVGWDVKVKSLITQTSNFVFYYLDGKWPLQRLVATGDTQGRIAESLLLHIGRTDVTLEEIPDFVCSQSIASNILFFWSSTATLHVRETDRAWDELDELSFSYNDKDVEFEWTQMPVLEAGHKELAEFVVIWGGLTTVLAVLLVDWKDGVAYRQGLATVLASEWVKLDPIWKMISLG